MGWPLFLSETYPANYSEPTPPSKFASEEQWRSANSSQPLLYRLIRTFVIGATHSSPRELHFSMTANETFNSSTHQLIREKYSSILSEVAFLKDLTSSVSFNRSVMDILEGIIITLSVVVAFILVFLIREWVIQQQPLANLDQPGAADQPADANEVVEGPRRQEVAEFAGLFDDGEQPIDGHVNPDTERVPAVLDPEGDTRLVRWEIALVVGWEQTRPDLMIVQGPARRQFAELTGWNNEGDSSDEDEDEDVDYEEDDEDDALSDDLQATPPSSEIAETEGSLAGRPDMPSRGRSFLATGIQRDLQEQATGSKGKQPLNSDIVDPLLEQANQSTNGTLFNHLISEGSDSQVRDAPTEEGTIPSEGKPDAVANNMKPEKRPTISPSSSGRSQTRALDHRISRSESTQQKVVSERPANTSNQSSIPVIQVAERKSNSDTNLDALTIDDSANRNESDHTAPVVPAIHAEASDQPSTSIAPIPSNQARLPELPQTWYTYLHNWFWGDIILDHESDDEEVRLNDEHVVDDLADEEPFVPFEDAQPVIPQRGFPAPGPQDIVDRDGDDVNDADAADDAEDLEGILELIGMQGPIIGLFQNAIFSTLLITCTIVGTVQLPYVLGKLELIFLGNLDLMWQVPLRVMSITADFLADLLLLLGGYLWFFAAKALSPVVSLGNLASDNSNNVAGRAGTRLTESLYAFSSIYEPSASLGASMLAHASLKRIQYNISYVVGYVTGCFTGLSNTSLGFLKYVKLYQLVTSAFAQSLGKSISNDFQAMYAAIQSLLKTGTISVTIRHDLVDASDLFLAYWDAKDRLITILVGYSCIALLAAVYVAYLAPVTSSPTYKRMEMAFVEVIKQAGGVCKVIFIISIEMIAFPLFCGFLLDWALLPLFENSSVNSRLGFTYRAPWTSGFVHWFVGTCYMFHFALFVSMCRKIMRSGVLYFIRDPDDPTFHPVRDVLERSVTVQLRKIAFSAVVYGTLITVCLGGVVWSLALSSKSVLPIHWSSSESEREFPLDILFFNFLTPLVVKLTKPTDGLHAMYKWWFRRSARTLRLSSFLFNEEHIDEEGPYGRGGLTSWLRWLSPKPKPTETVGTDKTVLEASKNDMQIVGRYARVPASDQIRIPKGTPVFVDVDKDNNRIDGKPDTGVHSRDSRHITKVYIPPWFKVRIGLFVLTVWLFAAATGLSVTIVPLLFGRCVLSLWVVPSPSKINDIYAFSLGIYTLGTIVYFAVHSRSIWSSIQSRFFTRSPIRLETIRAIANFIGRATSVIYVYSTFAVGLPILLAIILELYVLLPLHTYLGRSDTHIVHLVQDWTLGILYVRIFSHFAMATPTSAPARIAATILLNGYLRPNARVATRAFVLPALLMFLTLALVPLFGAKALNATFFRGADRAEHVLVLRLAYPTAMGFGLWIWVFTAALRATGRWRQRIKDEVYLIGERLHNFNEKRQTKPAPGLIATLKEEDQGMRQEINNLIAEMEVVREE